MTFFPSFVFITLVLIPGGKTATNAQMETLAAQAKERREDNSVEGLVTVQSEDGSLGILKNTECQAPKAKSMEVA